MTLTMTALEHDFAICRLNPQDPLPQWGMAGEFFSLSHSAREVTLTCEAARVPEGVQAEGPWRALELAGPFDFALTGILVSVLRPLAEAGIGIFALSTFDTDYVLVKSADFAHAIRALRAAGHTVHLKPTRST